MFEVGGVETVPSTKCVFYIKTEVRRKTSVKLSSVRHWEDGGDKSIVFSLSAGIVLCEYDPKNPQRFGSVV